MAETLSACSALLMQTWATRLRLSGAAETLQIDCGPRSTPMAHSVATGEGLVSNGHVGVDVIRLAAGTGFAPHTHPGDHLLIVIGGEGTVTYGGYIYPTQAGQVYLVPGAEPHAVGAVTDHVILAVGAPHKAVESPDRMALVAYQAILASFGDLHCLLCAQCVTFPARLHDQGCPHCPCPACVRHT